MLCVYSSGVAVVVAVNDALSSFGKTFGQSVGVNRGDSAEPHTARGNPHFSRKIAYCR